MYVFTEMDADTAREIDSWSYPEPYDFYDLDADPADRALFLDSSTWPDRYFAVRAADTADLVGFVCFEDTDERGFEIGIGMAPERTGHGDGIRFVEAALAFAQGRFDTTAFTLAVATFNERAIRVYERVGFEKIDEFEQETNGGVYPFVRMSL